MEYNVKSIREEFHKKGIFYTPEALANTLKEYIDIEGYTEVYDPTCGSGSLLSVFGDDIAKFGQEINEPQAEEAKKRLKNATIVCGDTLLNPAFFGKKFKAIVANYPYSIKWLQNKDERFEEAPCLAPASKADFAFILHILYYLADDGVAVTLNFPGILYRGQAEGKIRKHIVEMNCIDKVIQIPKNTFVDTGISTVLIVFKKNRGNNDSVYFEDKEIGKSRTVSLKEIADNDFNLSVSSYIQPDEKQIVFDAPAEQTKARQGMIQRLFADLATDKMICELEGWNHEEYVNDIIGKLTDYKDKLRKGLKQQ